MMWLNLSYLITDFLHTSAPPRMINIAAWFTLIGELLTII